MPCGNNEEIKNSSSGRNLALDGLRGYAALVVALGHCVLTYVGLDIWYLNFMTSSNIASLDWAKRSLFILFPQDAAVMVFFVLSGHVLWGSFNKHPRPTVDFGIDYAISRLFRLYPAVWASVLLIAGLAGSYCPPASISDLTQNALLLSNSVNGVLWSLQVEIWCSFVIFFVWSLCGKSSWRLIWFIVVIFFIGHNRHVNHYVISYEKTVFVLAFCLGATISALPNAMREKKYLLIIGIFGLPMSSLLFGHSFHAREGEVLSAWLIVSYVGASQPRLLTNKLAQFLGKISYPFYLTHLIGIAIAFPLVARIISGLLPKIIALAIISIAITVPIAWLIHVGIEMPAMRSRPRWRSIWAWRLPVPRADPVNCERQR